MDEQIHIIYTSKAEHDYSPEQLNALLANARRNNQALGVTGMLLYTKGSFFQVLEGERETVEALFERISRNPGHSRITKIIQEAISERTFSDWSMGYAGLNREQLAEIEGSNDFFSGASCLTDIDRGRAFKLLKAFSSGRWRLR